MTDPDGLILGIKDVAGHHLELRLSAPHLECPPKFFFNDTATTEIYTILFVGSVRCV